MRWRTVRRQGLLPLSKVAFELSNTWRPGIHSLLPTTRRKKDARQSQCKRIQKRRRNQNLAGGVEAVVLNRNLAPHIHSLPRGLMRLSQRTMVEFTRLIAAGRKLLLQDRCIPDRRQRDVEIVELRKKGRTIRAADSCRRSDLGTQKKRLK